MPNPPTISNDFPPNIEEIRKAFPLTGNEIFAYDEVIYHPGAGHLTAPLIAHEQLHFEQQKAAGGADVWWERYLRDVEFRYEQELEAHRKELYVFCQLTKRREHKWKYADQLARRLSSPTYMIHILGKNIWQVAKEIREGIL